MELVADLHLISPRARCAVLASASVGCCCYERTGRSRSYAPDRGCSVLRQRMPGAASVPHREIKRKTPRCWYKVYGDCAILHLISACHVSTSAVQSKGL
eukprot:740472-Rhodomonas_salina.3